MARIGVVGTGGWGKNHVRVLGELGALAAVCDVDTSRTQIYSKKYGVSGYSDFDGMVKKEKLDGVTICTPASTHFEIASKAIQLGLHTFVEKPMVTKLAEAEKLIELAERFKTILTVGFIERFNPAITQVKKLIGEGSLGAPILLEFHRESRRGDNIKDVGVVKDASVHDVDTARWLFNEDPTTVFARVGSVTGRQEDFAAIMLGFGEQRTAFLMTNWVTPNRVRTLTAVFAKGVVTVDFVTQEMRIHEENGTKIPKSTYEEPLLLELKEYVWAIKEKRNPLVTGKDGLSATRIAEAILASSKSGSPIYLSK
jgi:UDP-N-acetylglucosamine 3-dehydrogenase